MTEQREVRTGQISIDEPTTIEMMIYYGIDNHDELVRYIRHLGIEHDD